jgi:hypothetical protein
VQSDPQPRDQSPAPEQARGRWRSESLQAESTNLAETEEDQDGQDGSQLELVSDSSLPSVRERAASGTEPTTPGENGTVRRRQNGVRHPVAVHLAVLLGYIGAGVAVTWPHATYLAGRLPYTRDAGTYVWNFWWMARSVEHLSNPWSTTYLAAPVGTELGLHALMPLAGVVMMPVTVLFGPSASYNLLCIALPGLLSYVMYRVARLWLPSQIAAIATGAFFGLSTLVDFWTWNHVNLAAGALFVPLTLETSIRLRRRPGARQAIILGLVLGASVLVDQDSALMAAMVAVAVLLPWLFGRRAPVDPADTSSARLTLSSPRWTRLFPLAGAALVTAVVASPQLFAIAHEIKVGGPAIPPDARSYRGGASLPNLIEPTRRVNDLGLPIPHSPDFSSYGTVLTILAIAGLALAWRRRSAWGLALGWFGATVLAMGSSLHIFSRTYVPVAQVWHGAELSSVMPYTWLVRAPGLASFRVPARIAEVGLVAAALLAGYTVNWLRDHAPRVMIAVLAVAALEFGLSTPKEPGTMPTAIPALDRPIAADHSGSIVVDVPFGIRGGVGLRGKPFAPESQVLATADGHPLAVANLSRIPPETDRGISDEPFYAALMAAQNGRYHFTRERLTEAADNARSIHIGWVLLWTPDPNIRHFLRATGFQFAYKAYGVSVYRPAPAHR